MDPILRMLEENAYAKPATIGKMLNLTEEEVIARIRKFEEDKIILGYRAIIDDERAVSELVKGVIEVKLAPERGGGFNRLAARIAKFSEVTSCFLMSGSYDLLLIVEGKTLRQVATFVSEKLATLEGVLSTATHFMLKTYKEQGVLMQAETPDEKLKVSP
ncbi:MAG TPA: Lrp/AsnC family transcriptional regulator [Verrucomicrobiae bacterium]|nr:Lrp/AsnC family transcriptional regulator [Verrucomicrobiae bacterium]